MTDDKYLRVKQVCERTGLSRPTIYNMMNAGTFPMKTALGERAVAWLESEIVKWMESRKTFEKTGLEARPGRPPTASKKPKASPQKSEVPPKIAMVTPPPAPTPAISPLTEVSDPDGWGTNEPPPTAEEMERIHARLSKLNQPKKRAESKVVRKRK